MKYKNNKIYICHFPGKAFFHQKKIAEFFGEKPVKIDDDITVISIVNKPYYEKSSLFKQLPKEKVLLNKTAFEKQEWVMTDKMKYIVECLKECKTKYALVTDWSDVIFTADLDKDFINLFLKQKCNIIYNASTFRHPKFRIKNDKYIRGKWFRNKNLNAGLCFGYTDKLLDFYEYCAKENEKYPENLDEQFVIRNCLLSKFKIKIDGKRKLFLAIHKYEYTMEEKDGDLVALNKSPLIKINEEVPFSIALQAMKHNVDDIEEMYNQFKFYRIYDFNFDNFVKLWNFTSGRANILEIPLKDNNDIDVQFLKSIPRPATIKKIAIYLNNIFFGLDKVVQAINEIQATTMPFVAFYLVVQDINKEFIKYLKKNLVLRKRTFVVCKKFKPMLDITMKNSYNILTHAFDHYNEELKYIIQNNGLVSKEKLLFQTSNDGNYINGIKVNECTKEELQRINSDNRINDYALYTYWGK